LSPRDRREEHVQHPWSSFDEWLWNTAADGAVASLREVGEHLGGEQLTSWTLITTTDAPLHRISEIAGPRTTYRRASSTELLRIHDRDGDWLATTWPSGDLNAIHVVGAVPATDRRWDRFFRWAGYASPAVIQLVLDDAEITAMVRELEHYGPVGVSRLTARVRADKSSYARGWPVSGGQERPSFDAALAEIQDVASIRTLLLHVGTSITLHLRRRAGATFYSGDFALFEEVVLRLLATTAQRRFDLLSNRRRNRGARLNTAIAVELEAPFLDDPDAVTDLLDEMTRPHHLGIAVLHRNPYLHVVVTDYADGSNFDAFVTNDDRVIIHPGYRTTAAALARFTEVVSERFPTRVVEEVSAEDPPTLEDLLTTG
jgi:hypothetical protein